MKVSIKVHKRVRFYTLMIACGAFLWMMVHNSWIEINVLGHYALLTFVLVALVTGSAAIVAFLIRFIANKRD